MVSLNRSIMAEGAGAAAGVISAAVGVGDSIAGISPTHRQCTIELQNICTNYSLHDPRYRSHIFQQ